jgi:hypothetical protein
VTPDDQHASGEQGREVVGEKARWEYLRPAEAVPIEGRAEETHLALGEDETGSHAERSARVRPFFSSHELQHIRGIFFFVERLRSLPFRPNINKNGTERLNSVREL